MINPAELIRIRERLKLSQMKLSKASGVSRYKIHLFENQYGSLTGDELSRITKMVKKYKNQYFRGRKK